MTTLAEKIQTIIEYTGATHDAAEAAIIKHKEDLVSAIAELSDVPQISGTKYVPLPPVVDDGHDAETKERIIRGRQLADILSAAPQNDLRGKASHYPDQPRASAAAAPAESQVAVP